MSRNSRKAKSKKRNLKSNNKPQNDLNKDYIPPSWQKINSYPRKQSKLA